MRLPETRFEISIWIEASKSDSGSDFSAGCSILKARSALNNHLQGQWLFEAEGIRRRTSDQAANMRFRGTDRHNASVIGETFCSIHPGGHDPQRKLGRIMQATCPRWIEMRFRFASEGDRAENVYRVWNT